MIFSEEELKAIRANQGATPSDDMRPYREAIAGIESSGRYGLTGPTHPQYGRALGRYQVMEANLPTWLREAGLPAATPEEFLANPSMQDAVFDHRFGGYVRKYGGEGAARAWFAGEGGMNDPARRDVLGTSVAEYARRFNAAMGRPMALGGPTEEQPVGAPTTATPAPASAPAQADVRNQRQPQTWTQWLDRPENRAFLFNAGIHMMMPSWGGPMAQLASGLGAGAEAAAATSNRQQDMALAQEQLSSREREGALNRRTQLQIADIGAESRLDVANIRTQAMLERARMVGARTPASQTEFAKLTRSAFAVLMQNNPVGGANRKSPEELWEQAMQQAAEAMRRSGGLQPDAGATGAPGPTGAPSPAGPAGPTGATGRPNTSRSLGSRLYDLSVSPLTTIAPAMEAIGGLFGGTGGTGATGPTGAPAPAPTPAPSRLQQRLNDSQFGPKLQKDLNSRRGVARILSMWRNDPALMQELNQYLQTNPPQEP